MSSIPNESALVIARAPNNVYSALYRSLLPGCSSVWLFVFKHRPLPTYYNLLKLLRRLRVGRWKVPRPSVFALSSIFLN